ERRDQRADRGRIVSVGEDQPGRADVEREPEERRQQQRGREGGELERLLDPQADQQYERGAEDVQRQQRVEQRRRQRDDQDRDDPENRHPEPAVLPPVHARSPSRASAATICAAATYASAGIGRPPSPRAYSSRARATSSITGMRCSRAID